MGRLKKVGVYRQLEEGWQNVETRKQNCSMHSGTTALCMTDPQGRFTNLVDNVKLCSLRRSTISGVIQDCFQQVVCVPLQSVHPSLPGA